MEKLDWEDQDEKDNGQYTADEVPFMQPPQDDMTMETFCDANDIEIVMDPTDLPKLSPDTTWKNLQQGGEHQGEVSSQLCAEQRRKLVYTPNSAQ
jgi:hypothetical protein